MNDSPGDCQNHEVTEPQRGGDAQQREFHTALLLNALHTFPLALVPPPCYNTPITSQRRIR